MTHTKGHKPAPAPARRFSGRRGTPQLDERNVFEVERDETNAFFAALVTAMADQKVVKVLTGKKWVKQNQAKNNQTQVIFKVKGDSGGKYYSGHFVGCHKGEIFDSIKMKWQDPNSDGFCQTFAIISTIHEEDYDALLETKDTVEANLIALRFVIKHAKLVYEPWKWHLANLDFECYVPNQTYDYFLKKIKSLDNKNIIIELLSNSEQPLPCEEMKEWMVQRDEEEAKAKSNKKAKAKSNKKAKKILQAAKPIDLKKEKSRKQTEIEAKAKDKAKDKAKAKAKTRGTGR